MPHEDLAVRVGRDLRPVRRERPRRRRVRGADALGPGQRDDHGAARDDRRAEAGVGQAHHGGHPVLRLLAAGPQGARARADLGEAGGRPADHGRGRPGDLGRPALGPDPGVLQPPLRPPDGHAAAVRLHQGAHRLAGRGRGGLAGRRPDQERPAAADRPALGPGVHLQAPVPARGAQDRAGRGRRRGRGPPLHPDRRHDRHRRARSARAPRRWPRKARPRSTPWPPTPCCRARPCS